MGNDNNRPARADPPRNATRNYRYEGGFERIRGKGWLKSFGDSISKELIKKRRKDGRSPMNILVMGRQGCGKSCVRNTIATVLHFLCSSQANWEGKKPKNGSQGTTTYERSELFFEDKNVMNLLEIPGGNVLNENFRMVLTRVLWGIEPGTALMVKDKMDQWVYVKEHKLERKQNLKYRIDVVMIVCSLYDIREDYGIAEPTPKEKMMIKNFDVAKERIEELQKCCNVKGETPIFVVYTNNYPVQDSDKQPRKVKQIQVPAFRGKNKKKRKKKKSNQVRNEARNVLIAPVKGSVKYFESFTPNIEIQPNGEIKMNCYTIDDIGGLADNLVYRNNIDFPLSNQATNVECQRIAERRIDANPSHVIPIFDRKKLVTCQKILTALIVNDSGNSLDMKKVKYHYRSYLEYMKIKEDRLSQVRGREKDMRASLRVINRGKDESENGGKKKREEEEVEETQGGQKKKEEEEESEGENDGVENNDSRV